MRPGARRMVEVALVAVGSLLGLVVDRLRARVAGRSRQVGPVRLRRALESLGPTFMKLGQVLSTRPDLVSPAYERELSKLQDAGPAIDWSEVCAAVTRAIGPPGRVFAELDHRPLAAASIGQVHAGLLPDGREVVVKVQRPGVVASIEVDLVLLERGARLVQHLSIARRFQFVGLATEFAATITAELDYDCEAQNAERIRENFRSNPRVRIPDVVRDRSADGVLTETRIVGAKIDDIESIVRARLDRTAVARDFAHAYLTMVFVHRFFHADPHPGNVFVTASGEIGFVDFGMVGTVDEATGHGLATVLVALVEADAQGLADALIELGVAKTVADRAGLERDLARLLQRYGNVELRDLRLTEVVADLMEVVRRRDLHLPSRIALLLKTVVMCEGVAARLDPEFRLIPLLIPYAADLMRPPERE